MLTICTKVFDYDKIKENIICRTRQQGDLIAIGNGHQKKLKDFLLIAKLQDNKEKLFYCLLWENKFYGYQVIVFQVIF